MAHKNRTKPRNQPKPKPKAHKPKRAPKPSLPHTVMDYPVVVPGQVVTVIPTVS